MRMMTFRMYITTVKSQKNNLCIKMNLGVLKNETEASMAGNLHLGNFPDI